MPKLSEVRYLNATLGDTESLLELENLHPLERSGFERQRAELKAELDRAEKPTSTARAVIYFDGPPVAGSQGIEARFASQAIESYQDLLSKLAAIQTHGELGAGGPVPGLEQSKIHITNVVQGSFGFELEEVTAEQRLFAEATPLAVAVEQASLLIAASAESDDAFLEAVPAQDADRVNVALRNFLGAISRAGASVRVVTQSHDARLTKSSAEEAAVRVEATKITVENDVRVPGIFLGILLDSGRFEHRRDDGVTIKGRAARGIDLHPFVALTEKRSTAIVQVETLTRGTKKREKYTLLNLSPLS